MSPITISFISAAIYIILAGGLWNVWLVRFHKKTPFRGNGTASMPEEFAAYGLPQWFMYVVGFLKVVIGGVLIAGLWYPVVAPYALGVLVVLMLGAVIMHARVHDAFMRFVPALLVLTLALLGIYLAWGM